MKHWEILNCNIEFTSKRYVVEAISQLCRYNKIYLKMRGYSK